MGFQFLKISAALLFVAFSFLEVYSLEASQNFQKKGLPVFSDTYTVNGLLHLPYAEIKEPFKAYFNKSSNNSRIDYYGDLVQTYQLASKNKAFKIAYMPDDQGKLVHTCFKLNVTDNETVAIQSVLPDLTNFTYVVDESCENIYFQIKTLCSRWEYTEIYGKKVNKYTMWVLQNSTIPIRYQMKGYNSLLGSHYDKYEIYYGNFTTDVSDLVFNISKNLTCRSFPGPGLENVGEHNPMKEFIDKHDYHINQAFEDFKQTHDKKYKNEKHHETRKNIFRQNYRFIKSTNRASKTYSVKVNHLADLTDSEMRILRGRLPTHERNNGRPFDKSNYNPNIPETLDWRLYGAVTPVKDQAVCGSCWSFGTTGTIEGAYFLKTGNLVRLSQQQLIDCSWSNQNNGCDGGEDFRAYDYIKKSGGLATEEDYGPYLGQDGKCHDRNVNKTVQITGYVNVTSKDPDLEALRLSLVYNGPISVSIDASHKSFSFYSNGVYWEPKCGNKSDDLDHSVLAVGYGTLNGQPYWLIKNSWSTYWGNDGYVLMSQQDNNCGVATSPTFVLM